MEPSNNPKAILTVPMAIVIAAVVIAVAIVWLKAPAPANTAADQAAANSAAAQTTQANIKPITAADHILGNPNAPIKIVEYSDPSCPYCKTFFPTMQQIINQYGPSGQVAWVYRSFPLDKPGTAPDNGTNGGILHKNAGHESQALECAATLGGNDKFWLFAARLYSVTPSVTPETPNGLDQSQLPVIAKFVGLNVDDFNSCLASGKEATTVEAQYMDGLNAGVGGTPYSFMITPSGTEIPIPGAQPYASVNAMISTVISQDLASSTSATN